METDYRNSSKPLTNFLLNGVSSINWLRIGIHIVSLFPLGELAALALSDRLTANPIQFIEQFLGKAALNMLILALAVTPLNILTGWKQVMKHRRAIGLYSFFYFALHFLTFAVVDYGLDFREMALQLTEKPFIIAGFLAGVLLMALAATSFKFWMKKMGKNWQKLHRLVYVIGIVAVIHFAWAVKGSLTALQGDIVRPIISGLLVIFLLSVRIPIIKRWIISNRRKLTDNLSQVRIAPERRA
jgi:sulfoxide reductase heme-binding subunit YedZ